jgi:hypothetical protein
MAPLYLLGRVAGVQRFEQLAAHKCLGPGDVAAMNTLEYHLAVRQSYARDNAISPASGAMELDGAH